MNNIPKANLEDFTSKNSKTKKLFVKKIGIAFQEIGFLVLKGHSLSSSLQENLYKEIRDFFNLSDEIKLSYEIKDGLILTISSVNPDDGGESWVIINAKSNDKKSEKMAQEITKKTKGYEFLANIITSDILRWKLKDLEAKDKKS